MRISLHAGLAALVPISLAACTGDEPTLATTESRVDVSSFALPSLSELERAQIVHRYDFIDPTNIIPRGLLEDAILFFDVNKVRIPKTKDFIVVDLSRFSGMDRFWIVDTATGAVEKHKTAHGDGSDPDHDGFATLFSNVEGSHMSSLGFYLTAEIYDGTHPHSMRLDGLSVDGSPNGMANTNVRERYIVVHEGAYVDDSTTLKSGRSNGCLVLDPDIEAAVVERVHDGTLMYVDTKPLNTPVGRAACGDATCDGAETADSCAADCAPPVPEEPEIVEEPDTGGCSAGGGGAGLVFALGLVGVRRRRRVP